MKSALCLLAGLVAFSLSTEMAEAQAPSASYANRAACEQGARLTLEQCGFAFSNARAEFEEKAPRFRSRQDCVRVHKACSAQIVGQAGFNAAAQGSAIYVPSFQGVTLAGKDAMSVLPRIAAGNARFKPRMLDKLDDKVDGRVAVVPDSQARRGGGAGRGKDPQSSGPYVRRGERDDTIKMKLEVRNPNDTSATGLFVDKDGVEWYRPNRRR